MHYPAQLRPLILKSTVCRIIQPAHARSLTFARLVALGATVGFAVIAYGMASNGDIVHWDMQFAQWLHSHPQRYVIGWMRMVSWINGTAGIGLMSAALALWFWRARAMAWFAALTLGVPGVMTLNVALKHVFDRPRPEFASPWTSLTSYSFPSGHVSHSTVFYGLLAAWLYIRCSGQIERVAVVTAAWWFIGAVAASRLYLGAHYLTDVVAAFLEGVGWLALCHIFLAWYRHRNGLMRNSG